MISWLSAFLLRYAKWILLVILLLSVLMAAFIPQLKVVSSVKQLYPSKHNPARQTLEKIEGIFGEEASLVVVVSSDDVFRPETLRKIRDLSDAIAALPFVKEVESLATAKRIISTEDAMNEEGFLARLPETPKEIEALRSEYFDHPLYGRAFATPDSTATLINIIFKPDEEIGYIPPLVQKIHDVAKEYEGPETIYVSGFREMNTRYNDILKSDREWFIPLIVIVMMVMLFLNFRSLFACLLPMISVGVGILWTLAFMSLFHIPMSILTSVTPSILAAIGTAYGIYFVSAYMEVTAEEQDPAAAVSRALNKTTLALLFCGITTAVGFFVLSFNEINLIEQMGEVASIGVVALMIVTLFFLPILFLFAGTSYIKKRQKKKVVRSHRHERIEKIPRWIVAHSGRVLLIWLVVLGILVVGVIQVRIDNDPSTFFWPSSEIWKNLNHMQNKLNRYSQFTLVLTGHEDNTFKQPEVLRRIEQLEQEIDTWPRVGDSRTLADFIKAINQAFNENQAAFKRIPDTEAEVGQYLLLYSVAGDVETLHRYVTEDYRMSQVRINAGISSSDEAWKFVRHLQDRCDAIFQDSLSCEVSGSGLMFAISANSMAYGVFKGLGVALAVMLILMMILFRSFKIGVISMIPNIIPSFMLLGLMGLIGVPMNFGTSIILTIALGIAIDDTLHFFVQYYQDLKQSNHFLIRAQTGIPITEDQKWSIIDTWRHLYKPVTATSMTLACGFLVLLVSDLVPLVLFGVLTSVTLIFAVIADLILTPCLLARTRF